MKKILLFFGLLHFFHALPQTGYYGYKKNVSVSLKSSPVFDRVNKVWVEGNDIFLTQKKRNLRFTGAIQYEKIISKILAVAVGYNFSSLLQTGYFLENEERYFSTSKRGYYHGADIQVKYFRLGNKAPVGKYVGFSMEYGFGYFKPSKFIGGREFGEVNKGFRKKTWQMMETSSITSDIAFNSARFFLFNIIFGRSLPLTDRLFLTLESSIKFAQSAKHGKSKQSAWSIMSYNNSFTSDGNSNGNFYVFANSLSDYRRFTIDIGFHYNF
ncbi:MAG: hypothetical protein AB8B74_14045 [Crocinitomicaceae bacterium]